MGGGPGGGVLGKECILWYANFRAPRSPQARACVRCVRSCASTIACACTCVRTAPHAWSRERAANSCVCVCRGGEGGACVRACAHVRACTRACVCVLSPFLRVLVDSSPFFHSWQLAPSCAVLGAGAVYVLDVRGCFAGPPPAGLTLVSFEPRAWPPPCCGDGVGRGGVAGVGPLTVGISESPHNEVLQWPLVECVAAGAVEAYTSPGRLAAWRDYAQISLRQPRPGGVSDMIFVSCCSAALRREDGGPASQGTWNQLLLFAPSPGRRPLQQRAGRGPGSSCGLGPVPGRCGCSRCGRGRRRRRLACGDWWRRSCGRGRTRRRRSPWREPWRRADARGPPGLVVQMLAGGARRPALGRVRWRLWARPGRTYRAEILCAAAHISWRQEKPARRAPRRAARRSLPRPRC